jgi:hypothetical protein
MATLLHIPPISLFIIIPSLLIWYCVTKVITALLNKLRKCQLHTWVDLSMNSDFQFSDHHNFLKDTETMVYYCLNICGCCSSCSVREEQLTGLSVSVCLSVTFYLGTRQPTWPEVIVGTCWIKAKVIVGTYCSSGNIIVGLHHHITLMILGTTVAVVIPFD